MGKKKAVDDSNLRIKPRGSNHGFNRDLGVLALTALHTSCCTRGSKQWARIPVLVSSALWTVPYMLTSHLLRRKPKEETPPWLS